MYKTVTLAAAAIMTTAFADDAQAASKHTVQKGETLSGIAQKYKTTVGNLKKWNNLKSDIIYINQVLSIGGSNTSSSTNISTSSAKTYKVQSGDTLSAIAIKHSTTVSNLMSWNNLKNFTIFPGQVLHVSKSGSASGSSHTSSNSGSNSSASSAKVHTVKAGDTLSAIAMKYSVKLNDLMSWNNLKNSTIYPGQTLKVSKSSASSGSSNNSTGNSSSSPSTSAKTHTVKAGDTLSGIAMKYSVKLNDLMSWNNLKSSTIFPGQVLKLSKSSSSAGSANNGSNSSSSSSQATTYTVKAGDTLSAIANKYGMTVSQIKSQNNLKSDIIFIGQKLTISKAPSDLPSVSIPSDGSSSAQETIGNPAFTSKLVSISKSLIGVPYVWGGTSPTGLDCSGFIYYVFNKAGHSIGRYNAEGYYNRSYYVSKPQVGDLVFFSNTYKKGISHLGIYLGNNQFIHSDNSGVRITSMNNSYYKPKFEAYKRLY